METCAEFVVRRMFLLYVRRSLLFVGVCCSSYVYFCFLCFSFVARAYVSCLLRSLPLPRMIYYYHYTIISTIINISIITIIIISSITIITIIRYGSLPLPRMIARCFSGLGRGRGSGGLQGATATGHIAEGGAVDRGCSGWG